MTDRLCHNGVFLGVVTCAFLAWTGLSHAAAEPVAQGPRRVVRPAAVAGRFYDGDAVRLRRSVAGFLAGAKAVNRSRLLAGVVPHAGYTFSGGCAASLYAHVKAGGYDRIIVLGPSHRAAFRGISIPSVDAYRTPLGDVLLDHAARTRLLANKGFGSHDGAHAREHSIEVQLPFLQLTAGSFKFLPLLCGQVEAGEVEGFARDITGLLDDRTLILASSDFTHYGPNYRYVPFKDDPRENLYAWLNKVTGLVAALDRQGFDAHCRKTGDTICGQTPVRLLMAVLAGRPRETLKGQVISVKTSGDVVGDHVNSVSYGSVGFFAAPAKIEGETP